MRPGDVVLHPIGLTATALLAFNDAWLKAHHPGVWSGKLSDVAGMVVLPLTLLAVAELASGRVLGRRAAAAFAAITVVGFAAVETSPLAEWAWCWASGAAQWPFRAAYAVATGSAAPALVPVQAWSDPTDLFVLPFAALALVPRRSSGPPSLDGLLCPAPLPRGRGGLPGRGGDDGHIGKPSGPPRGVIATRAL